MEITADDILDAARTVWAESRSEPFDGQVAVAYVILNRAKRAAEFKKRQGRAHPLYGGGSLSEVVRQHAQFSPWLESDPQRDQMLALTFEDIDKQDFRRALLAVTGAIEGLFHNRIGDATHFYSSIIDPPSWADMQKHCGTIGRHAFFGLGDG